MSASWTETRVATLKQLWADGLSASVVAAQLGGITRNAVCGKIDRLGLGGRVLVFRAPRKSRKARKARRAGGDHSDRVLLHRLARPVEPEQPEAIDLPPDTSPDACTLMELTGESCRYPMGDPGTGKFRFCGSQKLDGYSYCLRHARIVYQPKAPRAVSTWGTR